MKQYFMKKTFYFSLFIALISMFSSCKKDDTPVLGAVVKVTVKNYLGVDQTGTTVYMYKDQEVNSSTKPSDAKKQIITDGNGVATFELNFTELSIIESQTTLYFGVFYGSGDDAKVAGSTGITIKRNETKNLEITIPL